MIGIHEVIHGDARIGKKELNMNIEDIRCVVSTSLVLIEVNLVIDRNDAIWIVWEEGDRKKELNDDEDSSDVLCLNGAEAAHNSISKNRTATSDARSCREYSYDYVVFVVNILLRS